MKKGKIVIISGPSGSGKTTLHNKLLSSPRIKGKLFKSISATTRPKRATEQHGRDYLFLSEDDFLKKKEEGWFLEWEKVFDSYYGTPREAAERLLGDGKNVLLCIDVKGAKTVKQIYPDAATVFVKAPSMEALQQRLKQRGSEDDPTIQARMQTAKAELEEAKHYDEIIVNDDVTKAYAQLEKFLLTKVFA